MSDNISFSFYQLYMSCTWPPELLKRSKSWLQMEPKLMHALFNPPLSGPVVQNSRLNTDPHYKILGWVQKRLTLTGLVSKHAKCWSRLNTASLKFDHKSPWKRVWRHNTEEFSLYGSNSSLITLPAIRGLTPHLFTTKIWKGIPCEIHFLGLKFALITKIAKKLLKTKRTVFVLLF